MEYCLMGQSDALLKGSAHKGSQIYTFSDQAAQTHGKLCVGVIRVIRDTPF
jgi:hypothetical protein